MFDISFSELTLIGVIALIVIGPERLPKVARTVGHLLGRAQRYVNDVKTDIRKEMDSTEIGNLKDQMQEAAQSVKSSVEESGKSLRAPLDEAQDALKQASESVKTLAESARNMREDAPPQGDESAAPDSSPAPTAETAGQETPTEESADTQTLPLPGFEHKAAAHDQTPADPPQPIKGPQS